MTSLKRAKVTSPNGCLVLIAFVPPVDYRYHVLKTVKDLHMKRNGIISSTEHRGVHRRATNPMRLDGNVSHLILATVVYVCQTRHKTICEISIFADVSTEDDGENFHIPES